jgi:ABC-2 type transport system permease protein
MTALFALYKSTAKEYLRDRMAILFTMLLPLMMAGFFGMLFSGGDNKPFHLNAGVSAPAGSPVSALFGQMPDTTVLTGTTEEILQAMKDGKVAVVVAAVDAKNVALYWDKSRVDVSGPSLTMVRQALQELNLQLTGATPPLTLQEIAVENKRIPMAWTYIPGMLSLGFLWLGVFGVAPPLVQMREQQVLRRLGATPLSRTTLLGAQVGWRMTTGLLQAALLIGFGVLAFHIRIEPSAWLPMLGVILLGGAVLVSLGFLLAGIARSNESVIGLGQVVQFPMMFLSGTLFPLDALPAFLKPAADAMPLTYLGDALRQLMLGAQPLFPLWVDYAVLGGFLVVLAGLAVRCFRWE